jgi:hypothetical protein
MNRPRQLLRPSALQRVLALSLAAVVLGGQFAGFAHLAFVEHVTCVEHGELVEVGRTAPRVRRLADFQTRISDAGRKTSQAGHEHCVVPMHRRDSASEETRFNFAWTVPPLRSATLTVTASPRGPPIALLLLAPKNSPPTQIASA